MWEEGSFGLTVGRYSPSWWELEAACVPSWEADGDECWFVPSFLFMQSWTQAMDGAPHSGCVSLPQLT